MSVAKPWRPSPHGKTPHLIPHIIIKCSAAVAAAQCCPGSHRVQLFSAAACQCCWCRYSTLPLSSAAGCCTRDVAAASTTEQRQQQWQERQRGGNSQAAAAVEAAAIINKTLLILSSFQLILRIRANWELAMGPIFFCWWLYSPDRQWNLLYSGGFQRILAVHLGRNVFREWECAAYYVVCGINLLQLHITHGMLLARQWKQVGCFGYITYVLDDGGVMAIATR